MITVSWLSNKLFKYGYTGIKSLKHQYIKGNIHTIIDTFTSSNVERFMTKYDIAYDLGKSTRFADRLFEKNNQKHFNKRDIIYLWHVKDNTASHRDKNLKKCKNFICGKYHKPQRVIPLDKYYEFVTNILDPQHSIFYKDKIKSYKYYRKSKIINKLIKEIWRTKIDTILLKHYRKMLDIKKGSMDYINDISYSKQLLYNKDHRFYFPRYKSISKFVNEEMIEDKRADKLDKELAKEHKLPGLTPQELKQNEEFRKWW